MMFTDMLISADQIARLFVSLHDVALAVYQRMCRVGPLALYGTPGSGLLGFTPS